VENGIGSVLFFHCCPSNENAEWRCAEYGAFQTLAFGLAIDLNVKVDLQERQHVEPCGRKQAEQSGGELIS
jgi:hypothetical protein